MFLLLASLQAVAATILEVWVVDATSGANIADVELTCVQKDTSVVSITDAKGQAQLSCENGTRKIVLLHEQWRWCTNASNPILS